MRHAHLLIALALCVPFVFGCDDDDPASPGPPATPAPTITNIWPHEDGRSWTYRFEQKAVDGGTAVVYPDSASVPAAPDVTEVPALLAAAFPGGDVAEAQGAFRLKFDGQQTTGSGAVGQRLAETLYYGAARIPAEGIEPTSWMQRLLRNIDPQARVLERAPTQVEPPLLLFGYAWEQTETHIGTYGDLDQALAWKFLEADLSVGHRFRHRLVPALASDVFLDAIVASQGSVASEVGTHDRAVTVHYVVDFGFQRIVNEGGTLLGYSRGLTYGLVVYAPGVGPVRMLERSDLIPDLVTATEGLTIEKELVLIGTGLEP